MSNIRLPGFAAEASLERSMNKNCGDILKVVATNIDPNFAIPLASEKGKGLLSLLKKEFRTESTDSTSVECAQYESYCPNTGACERLLEDPDHCGSCEGPGSECRFGEFCDGGTCRKQCPPGTMRCENIPWARCLPPNDIHTCGSCTNDCTKSPNPVGSICDNSKCTCPDGQEPFRGRCIPSCPSGSRRNDNGECVCWDPNQELVGGQCRCRAGLTSCGDPPVCVDIRFDEKNCNGCRVECGANEFCDNGVCTSCGPDGILCPAPDFGGIKLCYDKQTSNLNCGYCGNNCNNEPNPRGSTCQSGSCQCPAGQRPCNGRCVDTNLDNNNCGSCGTSCSNTPFYVGATCQSGECKCPADKPAVCDGHCVDVNNDINNCGMCGTRCNLNDYQQCIDGNCKVPDQCKPCSALTDCPLGTACYANKCFPAYPPEGTGIGFCARGRYSDGCYAGSWDRNGNNQCVKAFCNRECPP